MDIWIRAWQTGGDAHLLETRNQAIVYDLGFRRGNRNYEYKRILDKLHDSYNSSKIRIAYISHYHYDHYILLALYLKNYPSMKLDYLLLPTIPKTDDVHRKILYNVALELMLLKRYEAIPIITEGAKRIIPVARGDAIKHTDGITSYILWPPLNLSVHNPDLFKKLKKLAEKAYENAKGIARRREIHEDVEDYLDKLIGIYDNEREKSATINLSEPTILKKQDIEWREISNSRLEELMKQIEKDKDLRKVTEILAELGNYISLITTFSYEEICPLALMLGDAKEDVMNEALANLPQIYWRCYPFRPFVFFLKAAHHGTYYSNTLDGFRTFLLWIPSYNKKIKLEYFTKISSIYKILRNDIFELNMIVEHNCHKFWEFCEFFDCCRFRINFFIDFLRIYINASIKCF